MSEHPWGAMSTGLLRAFRTKSTADRLPPSDTLKQPLPQGRALPLESAGTPPGAARSQGSPSSCQAVSRPHLDGYERRECFHLSRYLEMLSSSDSSSNGNYMGANSPSYFPATSYSVSNSLEMQTFLQKK